MANHEVTQTFKSFDALACLLPATEEHTEEQVRSNGNGHVSPDVIEPAAVDDDELLSLASALKQSLRAWREQLARAGEQVERLRELHGRREQVEQAMAETGERFRRQKGWRALQKVVESTEVQSTLMDAESARLCERARELLAVHEHQVERALEPYRTERERLRAEIEAVEQQPAVRVHLAEQARQAEQARLTQQLADAQARYSTARTAGDLDAVQASVLALVAQVQGDGVLGERAEQLRAMVESDLVHARAREAERAERKARERFGHWIHALSKRRGADDLVLTFGLGQAVHLGMTGQRSAKGHPRVMLVSVVGFELGEPVLRTLVPDSNRERYYRLEPASDLPARGRGRAFDWQRGRRRPTNEQTQEAPEAEPALMAPETEVTN